VIGTETAIVPLGVDPVLGFPVWWVFEYRKCFSSFFSVVKLCPQGHSNFADVEARIEALAAGGAVAVFRLELEFVEMILSISWWFAQSRLCPKYVPAFRKLLPQGQKTFFVLIIPVASANSASA
jgi:hypothetical protein